MSSRNNTKWNRQFFIFSFYAISTGINKGIALIALPLLSGILSVSNFGIWSLAQIVIVVLAPLLSLNGYSALIRYGVDNKILGWNILKLYLKYCMIIGTPILIIFCFDYGNWIFVTLLLAQVEGVQILILGWLRSQDKHVKYFIVSLIKIFSLLGCIILIKNVSLIELLQWQTLISSLLVAVIILIEYLQNNVLKQIDLISKKFVSFSMLLIPHSISLWILSSSDRFIIKFLLGEHELGKYSIAYSIGLIVMLFNSGIALTLPNYILSNYRVYIDSSKRINLIIAYSVGVIILNTGIFIFIPILAENFSLIGSVDRELKEIILWVVNGIYMLGLYYFYSNILFYNVKASWISINTLIVSVINIILTFIFVSSIGIKGAAISTFISYLIYSIFNFLLASKLERKIRNDFIRLFLVSFVTIITNCLLANFFS